MWIPTEVITVSQVRTVRVETRKNEIVNRLNKTKTEQTPDLKGSVTRVLLLKEIDLFITAEQKSSLKFSLIWYFDLGFLLCFMWICEF